VSNIEKIMSESSFPVAYGLGFRAGQSAGAKQLLALAKFILSKNSSITLADLQKMHDDLTEVWKEELRGSVGVE
jgi:hypothetical protein